MTNDKGGVAEFLMWQQTHYIPIMDWIDHRLFVRPLNAFIDPMRPVERAIITHGHADHARAGHGRVLATAQTIDIMKLRYGEECAGVFQPLAYGETLNVDGVEITLLPAGHILGSAQIVLEHKGQRVVVTGDYKTGPDPAAQPFELATCNTLITEATFGLPVFRHGDARTQIDKLLASVRLQPDRCHVVGAYALGKTQRVIMLLRQAGYDLPIYLHGAQIRLCDYYAGQGVDLGPLEPATEMTKDDLKGQIVIAPPSAMRDRWSRRLPDPVSCFASGWMTIKQRAKQSLVELPLVISDHADWDELTQTISASRADQVWVTHGREDALVHWCQQRGIKAEPLSIQGREEEFGE